MNRAVVGHGANAYHSLSDPPPPNTVILRSESRFRDTWGTGTGVDDPRLLECDLALPDGVFAPLTGMRSLYVRHAEKYTWSTSVSGNDCVRE